MSAFTGDNMPSHLFSLFIMGEQGIFSVPFFCTSSVTISLFLYTFYVVADDGKRVLRVSPDQSIGGFWCFVL